MEQHWWNTNGVQFVSGLSKSGSFKVSVDRNHVAFSAFCFCCGSHWLNGLTKLPVPGLKERLAFLGATAGQATGS